MNTMAYALTKKENNKYNKYNGISVLIFKDNLINLNNQHPRIRWYLRSFWPRAKAQSR